MIFNQKKFKLFNQVCIRNMQETTNLIEPEVRSPRAVVSTF